MKELYLACLQAEAPPGGEWDWDYSQQDADPTYWDREPEDDDNGG